MAYDELLAQRIRDAVGHEPGMSEKRMFGVVAFLVSAALTDDARDLTGPLTALLVVQASAFSTMKMGAVRVGAVLAGIVVATVLSSWIGLTWWSLGAAIAISLVLAKILRLG